MKFTLSWLKEYLDTTASLDELCAKLTAIGLEVEHVADPAAMLKDFIVAEIVQASPHPNATKLQVCKVHDGTGIRQIVCGAANARAGLKTVLAREGVFIPGSGITIKKTKIRDIESNGMLCSAEELGLDTQSEGIYELAENSTPGVLAAAALGLQDPVIEINLTPNRADCLGVYGIARDLAAAGMGTLKDSVFGIENSTGASSSIILETPTCPYYVGARIEGVSNAQSPAWLQARLQSIGLKPISALVDITNYFTFAYGRPLHVYDADKLSGSITVRAAHAGEKLKALNDKEYTLTSDITVIADARGAVAIGGIIGGLDSACDASTANVWLEAAWFIPAAIAGAGRALELQTDARYRFERGVDPAFVETGAKLAVQMILELCGGKVSQLTIAGKPPEWQRCIAFNPARVASLGGVELPAGDSLRILHALGCTDGPQGITPPSWRADIENEAGLVEEILRIHGYDSIPAVPLPKLPRVARPAPDPAQKRSCLARRALAARGMLEVCSWSFVAKNTAALFGGGGRELQLLNPISAELDCMRPNLLPNLLTAARNNAYRGVKSLALFEVGAQFANATPAGQHLVAAGIRSGEIGATAYTENTFTTSLRTADAFDAKSDIFALISELGANTSSLTLSNSAPGWYHPGRSGTLSLGGKIIVGHFGELHPAMLEPFGMEGRACGFELFLNAVPLPKTKGRAKPSLQESDFQAVERDFAFVVAESVSSGELTRHMMAADKQLIKGVQIFDVYSGKAIDAGKKSIAARATLQAMDRTLTEHEIHDVSQKIIQSVEENCHGVLRR